MKTKTFTLLAFMGTIAPFLLNAQNQTWETHAVFKDGIYALEEFDGELFISGGFFGLDDRDAYWSAKYDGNSFTPHTNFLGGSGINDLAVFNNTLYGVGLIEQNALKEWTGSTWQSVGNFNNSHRCAFAGENYLYIGSDFGKVSRMDENENFTTLLEFSDNSSINDILLFNGDPVITGDFNVHGNDTFKFVARYNNGTWEKMGRGLPARGQSLTVVGDTLFAGGSFVSKWDGQDWQVIGAPNRAFYEVEDMTSYDGKLYAIGDFRNFNRDSIKTVTSWDGNEWQDLNFTDTNFNIGRSIGVYNQKLFIGVDSITGKSHLYSYELETSDTSTSVKNAEESNIHVFPNPLEDALYVQSQKFRDGDYQLTLTNSLGQKVIRQPLQSGNNRIFVENLDKGLYIGVITNLQNGEVIHRNKLIKD